MNNLPLIVSFYTNDWEYPDYAARLKKDCETLNLECHIVERPTTGDYIRNTSIKPFFIRDTLEEFKRHILWIDCDGSLYQLPRELKYSQIKEYDFAARVYSGPVPRAWHVGTLWFNYNDNVKKFVNDWCERSELGTDENSFEQAWKVNQHLLTVYKLPPEYFIILNKQIPVPGPDTVVAHRLSKSPDKLKRKYANRGDKG